MASTTVDRKRILILAGAGGCLLAFLVTLVVGGGFFAWRSLAVAPPTPTPRSVPTMTPTRIALVATPMLPTPTAIVEYQIYASKTAFFSVQYPRGWAVNDQEQSQAIVTFTAPDKSAQQSVAFGAAGSQNAEQALNTFLTDRLRKSAPDVRVLSQRAASDGSALADLEYTSAEIGRARGVLRVVVVSGGFYYAVLFSTKADQFDRATAEKFVDGLSIGK